MPHESPFHATPDNPVVGILGIIRRQDRLLMIQRAEGVRAPLMWCFPGGHIEEGETQTQALIREMREELNVEIVPGQYLMTQTKHGGRLVLHCWSANIPAGEPTPNPAEIVAILWMTPAEIRAKSGVLAGTTAILDAIGM
jgi:ADP-ribose pyrophosphatase YjhB (NUDIX family)